MQTDFTFILAGLYGLYMLNGINKQLTQGHIGPLKHLEPTK